MIHFLCFSLGAYTLGYYWIPYTISEFGNIDSPFNQMLGILFSLIIVPHFLILILVSNFLQKIITHQRLSIIAYPLIALIITLIEHFTPTQFPTYLAHPFGHLAPYISLAPIFGTIIFSFISFWLILTLTLKPVSRKNRVISVGAFSLFIICNYQNPLTPLAFPKEPTKQLSIRMVQANVGNFLKLSSKEGDFNSISEVITRYQNMSMDQTIIPDLIIWPETAYPKTLFSKYLQENKTSIPELFKEIIDHQKADLFIGGYDYDKLDDTSTFETEYNAAFLFKHSDQDLPRFDKVYHKIILLAFGETLPFGVFNTYLGRYVTNISYFKKGNQHTLFETKKNSFFISSICYEILQPQFTRKYLNAVEHEPHFIINLTNDSWYGISSEPYQHLFLAKWRAFEFKIPIIRMTNTGLSSILYPDGSESKRSKLGSVENLDQTFAFTDRVPTIYQRYGYLPFFIFWLLIAAITALINYRKEKPSQSKS
ncbi:MAG: apolipoprotein N-acyltransferase [Bdellovibrionales bacterium RIFOXYB1_FULL_37_110]|nr:MAG: apolipoprotein N-acyltransferase [Bdellovibrionales bacterium RIFOXYA1_FULL_38_20]OFZ51626.1 MAG: apolipoprotein N-acyltransferase [Bdellovibrionales bacterium RIFOXYC1_FULL_37_79]OFZ60453.1 MAG: apolipoprotein N-acyltransferase [Bdellovibrionales bacterium RIFOXYB1_FULL_37_110]OFZ65026.1 MAG: apolipoprotein N-acyltransferase [Bdellovibrionales bacterium RIFOXYD1_FULL_36_51]